MQSLLKVVLPLFVFFCYISLSSQTIEEMFSTEGLSINAYHVEYTSSQTSSAYSFYKSETHCEDENILIFVHNENGNRKYFQVEEEKVYVYNIETCQKTLRYDFGLEVGETVSEGIYTGRVVVDKYAVTLLNGETRMRIDLSSEAGGFVNSSWIEGIGDVKSGLTPNFWDWEGYDVFSCAKIDDQLLWMPVENEAQMENCELFGCARSVPFFESELTDFTLSLSNQTAFADSYLWDFGDGTTSTQENPVHSYTDKGCYRVRLTTFNECNPDGLQSTEYLSLCVQDDWDTKTVFEDDNYEIYNYPQFKRFSETHQMVYSKMVIYESLDNGATWTEKSIPEAGQNITRVITDLEMYDELNGIAVCGHYGASSEQKAILTTHDGGNTWLEKSPNSYFLLHLVISEDGRGWTSPSGYSSTCRRTFDYGDTWEVITYPGNLTLQNIELIDETMLVAKSYEGIQPQVTYNISKSYDNGNTWGFNPLPTYIDHFTFLNTDFVYGFGDEGIYKSIDGGVSWELINTFIPTGPSWLRNYTFLSPEIGWVGEENGPIIYTNDGFETYSVSNCQGTRIHSLTAVNENYVLGIHDKAIWEYDNNVIELCIENDADNDGVIDGEDVCQGADDYEDTNGNGMPDGCDPVKVNLQIFLEGAYIAAEVPDVIDPLFPVYVAPGEMETDLNELGLLPLSSPYSVAPWYAPPVSFTSIPEDMVDWILVEVRNGINPEDFIEMQSALLMKDGTVMGLNGDLVFDLPANSEIHFVIRHRNHLDVLSANSLERDLEISYNFTSVNQAYGAEALKIAEDSRAMMYAGDVNQDFVIQTTDFDAWTSNPSQVQVYSKIDMNMDGIVQATDYDLWFNNKSKLSASEIAYP